MGKEQRGPFEPQSCRELTMIQPFLAPTFPCPQRRRGRAVRPGVPHSRQELQAAPLPRPEPRRCVGTGMGRAGSRAVVKESFRFPGGRGEGSDVPNTYAKRDQSTWYRRWMRTGLRWCKKATKLFFYILANSCAMLITVLSMDSMQTAKLFLPHAAVVSSLSFLVSFFSAPWTQ